MPRQNIVFAIVTPLILMAIIAVIVVSIGETLLATHHWAHHFYHVDDHPEMREVAAFPSVFIALGVATLFLIGGTVASRLAPQQKTHE
jgi:hypothetical protein